jgi:hypothetical protein
MLQEFFPAASSILLASSPICKGGSAELNRLQASSASHIFLYLNLRVLYSFPTKSQCTRRSDLAWPSRNSQPKKHNDDDCLSYMPAYLSVLSMRLACCLADGRVRQRQARLHRLHDIVLYRATSSTRSKASKRRRCVKGRR